MSDLYLEDFNENSFKTYNKKVMYNFTAELDRRNYANLVDFNFGEKFFYGKVQRNFVPMFFDNVGIKLKTIQRASSDGGSHSAINFVVDAFEEMATQFNKAVTAGKIYKDQDFLSDLKVYKSFDSPIVNYNNHLVGITEALVSRFNEKENLQIQNFNDFIRHFRSFILKSSKEVPFTFSAFLKSNYCPMTVSGLTLEISDLDYFSDEAKIQNFYKNKNWDYYLITCRAYGFMVDKNIPWRLVADISSSPMLVYAEKYGMGQTNMILNSGFARPDVFFMNSFRTYLLNLYQRVAANEITKLQSCKNGLIVEYVKPEEYTIGKLRAAFPDVDMLRLFFDIRFAEDPKDFTTEKKDDIINKCIRIYHAPNKNDLAKSLDVFEKIINQPFDYVGSTSYLYEQYKKGFGRKVVLSKLR